MCLFGVLGRAFQLISIDETIFQIIEGNSDIGDRQSKLQQLARDLNVPLSDISAKDTEGYCARLEDRFHQYADRKSANFFALIALMIAAFSFFISILTLFFKTA